MPDAVEQRGRVRVRRNSFKNQQPRAAQLQHAATARTFPFVTLAAFRCRCGFRCLCARITFPRSLQISVKELARVGRSVPGRKLREEQIVRSCAFIKCEFVTTPTSRRLLRHRRVVQILIEHQVTTPFTVNDATEPLPRWTKL